MAESNLQEWVQRWENGDGEALWQVSTELWDGQNQDGQKWVAFWFLYSLIDDNLAARDRSAKAKDLAESARWETMEELDLMILGGGLLTEPTGQTKRIERKGHKPVNRELFMGKVSRRELTERPRLKWPSSLFCVSDLKDPGNLAIKLQAAQAPLAQYIRQQSFQETRELLRAYDGSSPPSEALEAALVGVLNRLIQGPCLYDEHRFAGVKLAKEILELLGQNPQGADLVRLNRLLLKAAYPKEVRNLEWRGEKAFRRLFRRILIPRCQDALRGEEHQYTTTTYEYDAQEEAFKEVKDLHTWKPIPIEPTRQEDGDGQQAAIEEEMTGHSPDPQNLILERDALIVFVEALEDVAKQLRKQNKAMLAETVDCLILYTKLKVTTATSPNAMPDLAQLELQNIRDLLDSADIPHLSFDEAEAWHFIQEHLSITQDTLFKRKQRLCEYLRELPSDGLDVLRGIVGLLWWREMQNWVEDCLKVADRFRQAHSMDSARVLDLLGSYLRWMFAQGHPAHRSHPPASLQNVPLKELFKVNNPALLHPAYPTLDGWRQFVRKYRPNEQGMLAKLPELQAAIDSLRPRPIRLVTLMQVWLREEESTGEERDEV